MNIIRPKWLRCRPTACFLQNVVFMPPSPRTLVCCQLESCKQRIHGRPTCGKTGCLLPSRQARLPRIGVVAATLAAHGHQASCRTQRWGFPRGWPLPPCVYHDADRRLHAGHRCCTTLTADSCKQSFLLACTTLSSACFLEYTAVLPFANLNDGSLKQVNQT